MIDVFIHKDNLSEFIYICALYEFSITPTREYLLTGRGFEGEVYHVNVPEYDSAAFNILYGDKIMHKEPINMER